MFFPSVFLVVYSLWLTNGDSSHCAFESASIKVKCYRVSLDWTRISFVLQHNTPNSCIREEVNHGHPVL